MSRILSTGGCIPSCNGQGVYTRHADTPGRHPLARHTPWPDTPLGRHPPRYTPNGHWSRRSITNTDWTRGAAVWLPFLSLRKTTAYACLKNKTGLSTNKIEKKTSEKSQVRNKWRWEAVSTSNLDSQLINVVHPRVQQFSVSRLKHQIHVAIH